jgi:hypothetical protein
MTMPARVEVDFELTKIGSGDHIMKITPVN